MEWNVVTVIISLVGLFAAVATPMVRLNSTIAKLTAQMESFMNGLAEFKARYTNQLNEFKQTHDDLYEKVDDHEHRITKLEVKQEKGGRI